MVRVMVQDSSTFQLILAFNRRVNVSGELLLRINDEETPCLLS